MDSHIIQQNATLLQALDAINRLSGKRMTLLVTDSAGIMTGTLTDGDIRRALLRGVSLDAPVSEAMHRDFSSLKCDSIDVARLREIRKSGKALIPVLDDEGRIVRIVDTSVTRTNLPLRAVIMAGGKGERLRPMTLTTPKPLLKIDGKAIIDYNIEALAAVGVTDITVTVNYLADQLHDHFATPVAGVKVATVAEPFFMGTIGAVKLTRPGDHDTTLIMNSDLLTTISFEDMFIHHQSTGADITVAVIPYNISVPYAILSTDGSRVTSLEEKPSYAFYANAGIYMVRDSLLADIPDDRRTDATDFIAAAIADGKTVSHFPFNGTWIDIGSPADFRHACDLMARHRDFLPE